MIVGYNTSTPFICAGNYLTPSASTGVPRVDFPGVGRVRVIYESGYPQSALGSAFDSGGKTFYISPSSCSAMGAYGSMTSCATIIDENTIEYGEAFVYTTGTKVSATNVWPSAFNVLPYDVSSDLNRNYVVAHMPTLSMLSGNGKHPSAFSMIRSGNEPCAILKDQNTVSAFVKVPSGSVISAQNFARSLHLSGLYWDSRGSTMASMYGFFKPYALVSTAIFNLGTADLNGFVGDFSYDPVRIDTLVLRAESASIDFMFRNLYGAVGQYERSVCKCDFKIDEIYGTGVGYFFRNSIPNRFPDFYYPNYSGRIHDIFYECYRTPGSARIACQATSWDMVVAMCHSLEHLELDFMHASAGCSALVFRCSSLKDLDVKNFENISGHFLGDGPGDHNPGYVLPALTSFCGYTSLKDAIDYWSSNCRTASASADGMFYGCIAFPDYAECTASPVYSAWTT